MPSARALGRRGQVAVTVFARPLINRGACLGEPTGAVVAAAFAWFEPGLVTALWDAARSAVALDRLVKARDQSTVASLREVLADEDPGDVASLLADAAQHADGMGRPEDPVHLLWWACGLVREHRGDSHVAAAAAAGLNARYPNASRLLICADGGGSNGYRTRAQKMEPAAFAAGAGIQVTVCHLPPGTSKRNKTEHRLFSQITLNWRGRALTSHQVIVDLITAATTTTATGPTVHAELDTGSYPTGTRYTKKQVDALPITRQSFHGEWNYTVRPPGTP